MKKIFTLFAAVLFAGSMMATEVTFTKDDFSGQGTANTGSQVSATKDGVTFTYSKGYCADESLRCYAHGAMSITATTTITTINFTTTGGRTGGLDSEVTVNATSYSIADLPSQARLTEIKVTLGEGGSTPGSDTTTIDPQPGNDSILTMTCAEARTAALSVSGNNVEYNNGHTYTIRGYVTSIATPYSDQHHNASFWMADDVNGGQVLEAYRCVAQSADEVPSVGDLVEVTGKLTKYNSTPEFAAGCTCSIITAAADPVNLGAKTIAEFLSLKNAKDTCILTGAVKNIVMDSQDPTKPNKYGNFDLQDQTGTVYIYGLLTSDGQAQKFQEMDIVENDVITIKALYAEYNNNPQVKNAILVSVQKQATAVENIEQVNVTKIIRNGQVLILRDGIEYNMLGSELK